MAKYSTMMARHISNKLRNEIALTPDMRAADKDLLNYIANLLDKDKDIPLDIQQQYLKYEASKQEQNRYGK